MKEFFFFFGIKYKILWCVEFYVYFVFFKLADVIRCNPAIIHKQYSTQNMLCSDFLKGKRKKKS